MKINKKFIILILLLCLPLSILADVVMTDEAYEATLDRLKKDKYIIEQEQARWSKLKTAKPVINYTIEDNKVVIQTIEIPINKSKPLVYQVKFEVAPPEKDEGVFPLKPFLAGIIETKGVDAKVGIQVFNIEKMFKYPIGFNCLIGARSFGGSISYSCKKTFDNTMIHVFTGKTYGLQSSYGVGISLNF